MNCEKGAHWVNYITILEIKTAASQSGTIINWCSYVVQQTVILLPHLLSRPVSVKLSKSCQFHANSRSKEDKTIGLLKPSE